MAEAYQGKKPGQSKLSRDSVKKAILYLSIYLSIYPSITCICTYIQICIYMVVSLNYCSQNGGNVYRDPYYNGNPNIGPRIIGDLDQYPYIYILYVGLA